MSAAREARETAFDRPFTDGLSSLVAAADGLKAPLSLIRQLSLSLDTLNLPIEEQQRIFKQICLTSERALSVTNDLTRSIQLTDAMFELEPINPYQICDEIINELTPIFRAHERKIKLTSRKHSLLMVGSRDLLRRILINFSNNALRYTDKGQSVDLKVTPLKGGAVIRLEVRDYGPKVNGLVISKFASGDVKDIPIACSRPRTSGLGVYIANQFAEAMGAKIGTINHRNGLTFYVDLQASTQLNLL